MAKTLEFSKPRLLVFHAILLENRRFFGIMSDISEVYHDK